MAILLHRLTPLPQFQCWGRKIVFWKSAFPWKLFRKCMNVFLKEAKAYRHATLKFGERGKRHVAWLGIAFKEINRPMDKIASWFYLRNNFRPLSDYVFFVQLFIASRYNVHRFLLVIATLQPDLKQVLGAYTPTGAFESVAYRHASARRLDSRCYRIMPSGNLL